MDKVIFLGVNDVICFDGCTLCTKALSHIRNIINKTNASLIDISVYRQFSRLKKELDKTLVRNRLPPMAYWIPDSDKMVTLESQIEETIKKLGIENYVIIYDTNRYHQFKPFKSDWCFFTKGEILSKETEAKIIATLNKE